MNDVQSPDPLDPKGLNVYGLHLYCQQETNRYFRHGTSDTRYCLELFSRALRIPPHDNREQAWSLLTNTYKPLVIYWLNKYGADHLADGDKDALVHYSFNNFWLAFIHERVKWDEFPNVKTLLKYLYWQVRDIIKSYLHPNEYALSDETMPAQTTDSITPLAVEEAWRCIEPWLRGEQEIIVAYYMFLESLKPRHIWELYQTTGHFESSHEISRIRERILKRLKPHEEEIRRCLGGE